MVAELTHPYWRHDTNKLRRADETKIFPGINDNVANKLQMGSASVNEWGWESENKCHKKFES